MALLDIVQGTYKLCGISPIPGAAYTNSDTAVQQVVSLAKQTGIELMERYDWRNLKIQATVTGDGATTLFALPSDWQRMCPSSKSQLGALISLARPTIPLIGPVNDEWLDQMKALPAYPAYPCWRLVGGALEIWPALANREVVQFWYFSKNWVLNASGTTRQYTWGADTDVPLINENTVTLGTVWRWKQSKGLDYAEAFRAYELSLDRNAAQEDTERVVVTSSQQVGDGDTFWPGTISWLGSTG